MASHHGSSHPSRRRRGNQSGRKRQAKNTKRNSRTASWRNQLRRRWNKANVATRTTAVALAVIAAICAMALVMGLVRVVQWRVEVSQAEHRQQQSEQQYNFDPGNIISDAQFFNADAMSQAEVEAFIADPARSCTEANCLAARTFPSESKPADDLCQAYTDPGNESAGAIVYKSAQACGISEKVLLTMLQKEQHLLSTTPASDFQFKSAMGLSCPDDADCDPQYAGFFRQVYGAAKRFKYYQAHAEQYPYHSGTLNYVQYHPNKECGGTQVYISTAATALLYVYTPYQPNEAALSAGYGEGDGCSSYGNRNFSLIYSNWFGDPRK